MEQTPGIQSAAPSRSRPVAITIICILGFIGVAVSVPLVFTDIARQIAPWYPPFLGISAAIGATCMVGLWLMRKWAVYAYTAMTVINQVIMLATGIWTPLALILPAIVIVVMFVYLSQMR